MSDASPRGTDATREFYDQAGWQRQADGKTTDGELFGHDCGGPRMQAAHDLRFARIKEALASVPPGHLLEIGCGGNPATNLLDTCTRYTGIDFSETGVERANEVLADAPIPAAAQVADCCALDFPNHAFDTAYSAHCLYHIENVDAQASAFREAVRVLRPGGVAVFVLANARPLLDPVNLAKRAIADAPILGKALKRKRSSPLPYQPMSIPWMRRQLRAAGAETRVMTYRIPSNPFNRKLHENKPLPAAVVRLTAYLERVHPVASAYLGNSVILVATKR